MIDLRSGDTRLDLNSNLALRRQTRTGRPLGGDMFMTELEGRLGLTLRPRKPGPKPRPPADR